MYPCTTETNPHDKKTRSVQKNPFTMQYVSKCGSNVDMQSAEKITPKLQYAKKNVILHLIFMCNSVKKTNSIAYETVSNAIRTQIFTVPPV